MIIELNNGKPKIQPMRIPELTNRTFIQYAYEAGTNHLRPRLTINHSVFIGDRIFVDMSPGFEGETVNLKVELLDGNSRVLHTYEDVVNFYNYQVFGEKPVRPDVEVYINNLYKEISRLQQVIKELEEKGEVI